jgi:hypothetical protein
VWPFGPVRTLPSDPAVPELTINAPAVVVVDPEAPGETVDAVVDELEADGPELQAAAVTLTAARSAASVHSLRVDPGSDLFFKMCMCVSLCNRLGYRARVTYVHNESCPTVHIESAGLLTLSLAGLCTQASESAR